MLKLKKTLYGLCQASCAFWKYLNEKLKACRMSESKLDPCLFISKKVTCICYVDFLFWSNDEPHINELAIILHHSGVDLEQEDDATSFLGA